MKYEIINERKKELGITNAQLAEITGITLSTLDKITSGANKNPKLGTLQAIARAIGCTLDDFDDDATVSFSPAAMSIARKYEQLDDHGRQVVDHVADLELKRVSASTYADETDRFNGMAARPSTESTAL